MKKTIIILLIAILVLSMTACANYDFATTEEFIVTPKDALKLIDEGALLVDVQSVEEYSLSHIEGAINVPMGSLVVNEPYSNLLPEATQVAEVMTAAGITEKDTILVYDNASNMQAARVQWTLNMYSNFNVLVVSGGKEALKEAEVTSNTTASANAEYITGEKQKSLIVNLDYVKSQINNPTDETIIVDTRSSEEYLEGTIPGACNIEYTWNNYSNGEYKTARDIQNVYLSKGIMPDMKIILFCKTSVRATQSYTALKNAGYKDVRVYDGAWLEYIDKESPQLPTETTTPVSGDAS